MKKSLNQFAFNSILRLISETRVDYPILGTIRSVTTAYEIIFLVRTHHNELNRGKKFVLPGQLHYLPQLFLKKKIERWTPGVQK